MSTNLQWRREAVVRTVATHEWAFCVSEWCARPATDWRLVQGVLPNVHWDWLQHPP